MASISTADSLLSPTDTVSSFDILEFTDRSRASSISRPPVNDEDDDDDEVLLSVSSSILVEDDDFVLLGNETSHGAPPPAAPVAVDATPVIKSQSVPATSDDSLSRAMGQLNLEKHTQHATVPEEEVATPDIAEAPSPTPSLSKNQRRKARRRARASSFSSSTTSPSPPAPSAALPALQIGKVSPKKTQGRGAVSKPKQEIISVPQSPVGLGARSIVDDASERLSVKDDAEYEEAVQFIDAVLSSKGQMRTDQLAFLQALIIELGVNYQSLPNSLRQARALLKSNVFINVRDYLTLRSEGSEALQKCMYPSRSALVRDIKRHRVKTASLSKIKKNGLQVLLVSCYH